MEKIVIIGSSGSGKTSLARKLHSILNIKVVHLDRIFWQRGWKKKSREIRVDILQHIVQEKQWIIEGTYLGASEPRLKAADTIIFLDIKPSISLRRIIKRNHLFWRLKCLINKQQMESQEFIRRDLPEGSIDRITFLSLLKVLTFPIRGRRILLKKLKVYESKNIIWLRSPKEVEDFLTQLEAKVDNNQNATRIPYTQETDN